MLNATRDKILPTTVTGSYPRPAWFTEELHGRSFKDALGHARFRDGEEIRGERIRPRDRLLHFRAADQAAPAARN